MWDKSKNPMKITLEFETKDIPGFNEQDPCGALNVLSFLREQLYNAVKQKKLDLVASGESGPIYDAQFQAYEQEEQLGRRMLAGINVSVQK